MKIFSTIILCTWLNLPSYGCDPVRESSWWDLMVAVQNKKFILSKQKQAYDPLVSAKEDQIIKKCFLNLVANGELEKFTVKVRGKKDSSRGEWFELVASLLPPLEKTYGAYTAQEMYGVMNILYQADFNPELEYSVTIHVPVKMKKSFLKEVRSRGWTVNEHVGGK